MVETETLKGHKIMKPYMLCCVDVRQEAQSIFFQFIVH